MATWRCQQCGTPQAESSRCWVCSRSPMTCSTCRNFRAGVVAHVGFCALDRNREPLTGDEVRACWQAPIPPEPVVGLFAMVEALQAADGVSAPVAATPAAPASWYRPVSWLDPESQVAEPQVSEPDVPRRQASLQSPAPQAPAPGIERNRRRRIPPPASKPEALVPAPSEAHPVGRLVEAPVIVPALRLGSRGDARSLREAAETDSSANREGLRRLEGGTVL